MIRDTRSGKVIHVGKTIQGLEGDVDTRFKGHLAAKPHWRAIAEHLKPELIHEGHWTRFETACWEQHFIHAYGGLRRGSPTSLLENEVDAITKEKFDLYRSGYGHNPCA